MDCSGFPEEMFQLVLRVRASDWCRSMSTGIEVGQGEERESVVVYVVSKPFETNLGVCIPGGLEVPDEAQVPGPVAGQ